jgi:aldose 1-epimerase
MSCNVLIALQCLMIMTVSQSSEAAEFSTVGEIWGEFRNQAVQRFSIRNSHGMQLDMTNYGAKIVSLWVPDRNGALADVVLGYDTLQEYIQPNPSFGATIGRYANRIRDGRFEIDGEVYQLTQNEGENQLHGGGEFEHVLWDSEPIENELGAGVRFHYLSPDGSQGFPGNLDAYVTYILTSNNSVHVTFESTTDKATHVNFTQHSYFNLNGVSKPVFDHLARIHADEYVVMDGVLATGEIDSLKGKAWDLSEWTRLGDNMDRIPLGGYHHNYVADKSAGELGLVAEVTDPDSGRTLQVATTQPGVVFYASMGLTNDMIGKRRVRYGPYMAFCLETQHHIDAANHPQFPSTLLRPGETYREIVIYKFGIADMNDPVRTTP